MIETFSAFISSFFQVFAGATFGLMLLGILIGFAVGILPGLGGATTLALMLPFIFMMKPVEAFAFLLGMASVTNTTGDITSILLGVPGEPTTAATVVEGHPMAKKGEAGRALGAALMSSLVGAVFGAFALASAIPIIRPLVLSLGSPEFFVLGVLGLTFVASLSGEVFLKGLIAGGMGLLLSAVGLCPMSGIQRFTFGQIFLWDGVGLVPITIGFFAIPEIVDLAVQGSSIARGKLSELGGVMQGVKDTFKNWWLVIRCSAIGAYVGIIPGMGAATTQWLAYAHAIQSSKDKKQFGKGAVEGVLGPGAANNSSQGGTMIVTVAFGVPTSVLMAILLGAFIIQGLAPGPDMLIPEARGGHLSLTFSFVWTIVVANLITVAVCLLFLNQLAKITQIRGTLLIPIIILLVYLGAFAEKNAFSDLVLVLIFGALGWVLVRLDWPRPPLILGLVLGPLTENRLFLSIANYGLSWLWRPGVLLLIAITMAGALFFFLMRKRRKAKVSYKHHLYAGDGSQSDQGSRQDNWTILFIILMIAVISLALWESRDFDVRAGLFPWATGIPTLILLCLQLVREFIGRRKTKTAGGVGSLEISLASLRTAAIFGWLISYFISIWLLGFCLGGTLSIFVQLKIGYRERWSHSILLTGCAWALIYGIFERILHVPFPTGKLFLWL